MSKAQLNPDWQVLDFNAIRKTEDGKYTFSVKTQLGWKNVYRKKRADLDKIFTEVRIAKSKRSDQKIGKVTWLDPKQLREIERGLEDIERAKPKFLNLKNVEGSLPRLNKIFRFFNDHYKPSEAPTCEKAKEYFLESKKLDNIAEVTWNDYERIINRFNEEHGEKKVNQITIQDALKFINSHNPKTRSNIHRYFTSWWRYVEGKFNPHYSNGKWIPDEFKFIHQMKPPAKISSEEIESYSYKEILSLMKEASRLEYLPTILMKLYGLFRYKEFNRFLQLGSSSIKGNRYIDFDNSKLHLSAEIFLKRSASKTRGRVVDFSNSPLKTFLEQFAKEDQKLRYDKKIESHLNKFIKGKKSTNLIRHSAISFHLRNFNEPELTAEMAGTSVNMIRLHYWDVRLSKSDAEKFYSLTPNDI